MKGWTRWVLLIGGGLVAAALIGAGVLAYLVSRVDVRAEVERAVEEATGRDLTISGDVGVSFWPVLGLQARDAALANVEGGRAPALAAMDEIDVGVEIGPLFSRRVVVRRLVLQRPRIALEVDEEGAPNWLLAPAPRTGPAPGAPSEPSVDVERTRLREISINDGEVSFYDARRGSGWVIGEADLTSALTSLDEPMLIEGQVRYNDRAADLRIEIVRPGAAVRGELSQLKIEIESELLSANFDGRTIASSGELNGLLEASGPSLRQLAAWVGAPFQGGAGLEAFAVSGRIETGGGRFDFSNASFSLDRISGRGDFIVSEVRGKPYFSGRLEVADFDLNPYLQGVAPAPTDMQTPPATAEIAEDNPTPTAEIAAAAPGARAVDVLAAPAAETPIDFSGLHAFNADLELITGAVLVQHMRVDSARANLVINDGYLAATLQEIGLYGGSGRGRIEIDARQPAARLVQDMVFDGLDARAFLSDAINFSNIEGTAEVNIDLVTEGVTQSDLIAASDGRVHLEVITGQLHGVDLGGVARTIRNALRGELIAPEATTAFQGFSATFTIGDGALASENLSFNTPDLRITGIGVVDIPGRRLDARLAPRSPQGGVVVPFAVRGPWGRFQYTSDIRDTALREVQTRVRAVQAATHNDQ